jgi:hypothetical protein
MSYASYNSKRNKNRTNWLCKKCRYKIHGLKEKEKWDNKSEEEKELHKKVRRDVWKNKSSKEKEIHSQISNNNMKNMSPEKKILRGKKISASKIKYWNNKSKDEKEIILKPARVRHKKWFDNILINNPNELSTFHKNLWTNNTYRIKQSESHKIYNNNLSNEEKRRINKKKSISMINHWNNSSDKKEIYSIRQKEKWNNLSYDEYQRRCELNSSKMINYWTNITQEEKIKWNLQIAITNFMKANTLEYKPSNELSIEFEKRLRNIGLLFYREYPSIVINNVHESLIPEEYKNFILYTKDKPFKKNWDYLVYKPYEDKKLYVDLDGDIHGIEYSLTDEYLNTDKGKYIKNKYGTNNLKDIMGFYDNRRDNIICDKIIINKDTMDLYILKIIEYFNL